MGVAAVLENRSSEGFGEAGVVVAGTLTPLLAGARARGMADAFDLLGLAAVLLDEAGAALHVSARAQRLTQTGLMLRDGRLKAALPATDALLQAGIGAALAERNAGAGPVVVARGAERTDLTLRILAIANQLESAQLLRAVVLIDCADAPANQSLI